MMATQALGAIPVPLYQDAVAQEMVYVLQDAEVSVVVVEDQEQADKMLEVREQCPALAHVVYDDPRGMRHYSDPLLRSFEQLEDTGRAHAASHPGFLSRRSRRCARTTPAPCSTPRAPRASPRASSHAPRADRPRAPSPRWRT